MTGVLALVVLFAVPQMRLPRWAPRALAACIALPVVTEIVLSTWYLFSPTYIDHIEASAASIAQYFRLGIPVYPRLDSYTFHGLLYGPLLPELNALGYLVDEGALGSKLVGWAAAWLALVIMAVVPPRVERSWAWTLGLATAGCVLASFGSVLTADRADSLLLLFATLALWSVVRLPPLPALTAVGLLAGLAANLKLHGPAYILPALGWWAAGYPGTASARLRLTAVLSATAAMAAGFIVPFLPANISAAEYFGYLRLGAKHGLSLPLFAWNCSFLLCFWVPWLFALRAARKAGGLAMSRQLTVSAALLLAAELAVNVVAAKPGAGPHHMLPFIAFHALLLQQLLVTASPSARGRWIELPAARAAMTGIAVVLLGTAWSTALGLRALLEFDLQWPSQQAQLQELRRFTAEYPHGMLGVAGRESYALTSFRHWITRQGTLQTDYGAWMDWSLSGVSDLPLANALETCRIPYLYVPSGGEPFTVDSGYGTGALFSDAVRLGFAHSYRLIHPGQYFNVYECNVGPSDLVRRASP